LTKIKAVFSPAAKRLDTKKKRRNAMNVAVTTTSPAALNSKRFFEADNLPPQNWAPLLRKLRWLGLETAAERLEVAISAVPPEKRYGVAICSSDTD
jgi:hypothetical protein